MFNMKQATIPSAFIYAFIQWTFNETQLLYLIISRVTCLVVLDWTPSVYMIMVKKVY